MRPSADRHTRRCNAVAARSIQLSKKRTRGFSSGDVKGIVDVMDVSLVLPAPNRRARRSRIHLNVPAAVAAAAAKRKDHLSRPAAAIAPEPEDGAVRVEAVAEP